MRFLDTSSFALVTLPDRQPFEYAILSYTWSKTPDEPTFHDAHRLSSTSVAWGEEQAWPLRQSPAARRIVRACDRARAYGIPYLWVDSLCIDQSSSADIIESVICSFRLVWEAALCIVYLSDLPPVIANAPSLEVLETALSSCRWFTRLWTLPELVAPRRVEFFDRDWNSVSVKDSDSPPAWLELLSRVSGVDLSVLANREMLFEISLGRRLSWAAYRQTTRPEDVAYVLAGICGVGDWLMPQPGEGSRIAFRRLQQKLIMRTSDLSILAWKRPKGLGDDAHLQSGILAESPADFSHFASHPTWATPFVSDTELGFDSRGLRVEGLLSHQRSGENVGLLLLLNASQHHLTDSNYVGIMLEEVQPGIFVRSMPWSVESLHLCKQDITMSRIHVCLDAGDADVGCRGNFLPSDSRILAWANAIPPPLEPVDRRLLKCSAEDLVGEPDIWGTRDADSSSTTNSSPDEDDILLFDSVPEKLQLLDPGHRLLSALQHLVALGAEAWEQEKSPLLCPGTPASSRRRVRHQRSVLSNDSSESKYTGSTISSSPSLVFVRPANTRASHAPLACPFYRLFPSEHYDCLWSLVLPDIRSLIQHLIVDHRLSYFCPSCHRTFPKASDRDRHIVARSCKLREDVILPVGVSEDQVGQLDSAYRQSVASGMGEEAQWFHIWGILFPGAFIPSLVHLLKPQEREVIAIRQFWREEGHMLILDELERQGLIRLDKSEDEPVLEALHASVLKGILETYGLV